MFNDPHYRIQFFNLFRKEKKKLEEIDIEKLSSSLNNLLVCAILKGINISYSTKEQAIEFDTVEVLNQELATSPFQNNDNQELQRNFKKSNTENLDKFLVTVAAKGKITSYGRD